MPRDRPSSRREISDVDEPVALATARWVGHPSSPAELGTDLACLVAPSEAGLVDGSDAIRHDASMPGGNVLAT
jgi:hypothetical protein